MQTHTIEELVQIVDTKVLRDIFINRRLCKNVLHHTDGTKRVTLLEQDGLIDGGEVLEESQGLIRKFHWFAEFHHWL